MFYITFPIADVNVGRRATYKIGTTVYSQFLGGFATSVKKKKEKPSSHFFSALKINPIKVKTSFLLRRRESIYIVTYLPRARGVYNIFMRFSLS